jgi:TRAP-type C4-dicarboxylate transport system permease small subunit
MLPPSGGRATFERALKILFIVACVVALPFIALLTTVDTILRYVFSAPLAWSQDAVGLALFLLFCAGLPYSWYSDVHVRMDMIYLKLPQGWRRMVDVLAVAAATIFAGFLAYQSIVSAMSAWRFQSATSSGVFPIWPVQALGAVLLILFGIAVLESITRRRAPGDKP